MQSFEVEARSIEFVPTAERYGGPKRLFTIWFSANLSIVCASVGALGVIAGLSLPWTVLGLLIGNGIGTIFMAAHSAQGPHLGVPQMIQSRAQFGVLGAAVPLVAVIVTYILYTAADGLVVENTLAHLLGCAPETALILFGLITLVIAYVGYELIHRIAAVLAIASAALFIFVSYRYWTAPPVSIPAPGGFNRAIFLATVTQAAAWSLSYGPYVADYSRYLRPTIATSTTFWYTASGCFLGASATMAFGAYLASIDPRLSGDLGAAIVQVAPAGSSLIIVLGVLIGNVMNVYSAYMSSATIFAGFARMSRLSWSTKLLTMVLVTALATAIAWVAEGHFGQYFGDILAIMAYLLIPWSAINLADYYIVRKGQYEIADLYNLDGVYGRVRTRTLMAYTIGILAEAPFMRLTVYEGLIAQSINVDLAWAVGLMVSGLLYVLLERNALSGLRTPA